MYEVIATHLGTVYYGSSYQMAFAAFTRFKRKVVYAAIYDKDGTVVKEYDRALETYALDLS